MKKAKEFTAELSALARKVEWPDNCFDAVAAIRSAGNGDSRRAESLASNIHAAFYPEAYFSMRCAVAIGCGDLNRAQLLLNDLRQRLGTDKRAAA